MNANDSDGHEHRFKRQKLHSSPHILSDPTVASTSSLVADDSTIDRDIAELRGHDDGPLVVQRGDIPEVEDDETTSSFDQSKSSSKDNRDGASSFEIIDDHGDGTRSPLCRHCQRIVENWSEFLKDEDFSLPHHEDIFQLEKAVNDGCSLCYQFWRSASTDKIQQAREEMNRLGLGGHEASRITVFSSYDILQLAFPPPHALNDVEDKLKDYPSDIITFYVCMIASNPSAVIPRSNSGTTRNTRDSLALAARWLERCRKSHSECSSSGEDFIPTRLVSTKEDAVRVCLSANIQRPTSYATLSHCWGKVRFLTLERSNLETFQSQVPQEALSQTIKDAIDISRQLGFPYLWIDTLCIIQDDPDDWARESASMSTVYGGSGLNIAASGAVDGRVGCFFNRPQSCRCHSEVQDDGQAFRYDFVPERIYEKCLANMPLLRRGWAFQERLLAPRTLHFTTTEVFWECHHNAACESFPDKLSNGALTVSYFEKRPLSLSMWSWIAENYSSCGLTYARDKLVAISGPARHIQKQTGDQYVAGMWRKNLEVQLCWRTSSPIPRRVADAYIAPTWSWMSVDSAIIYPKDWQPEESGKDLFLWIKILNVKIRLSGPDPCGPLSGASLLLNCRFLLRIQLKIAADDYMFLNHEEITCQIHPDFRFPEVVNTLLSACALPVYRNASKHIEGLLLEPTSEKRGQYRRIGYFLARHRASSEEFESAAASYQHAVGSADCLEVRKDDLGHTSHVIELV